VKLNEPAEVQEYMPLFWSERIVQFPSQTSKEVAVSRHALGSYCQTDPSMNVLSHFYWMIEGEQGPFFAVYDINLAIVPRQR
jgi:hypothetical protein